MKKVLSYVIWGNEGRYWNNFPYLLIANSCIYPDFWMKFYIHENATGNYLFSIIEEAEKEYENIEIEVLNTPYQGTQLTNWRMKLLWEKDVDFFFCRDLDYAINSLERRSVQYFLNQTSCIIHGIRSYGGHTVPLMAGLCGFNVKEVIDRIQKHAPTFEDYIRYGAENVEYCSDWRWGCDQALLRDFFGHVELFPLTLDCPQFTAPLRVCEFPAEMCLPEVYENIELPGVAEEVLAFSSGLTSFAGQPWNCNLVDFKMLMGLVNNEMTDTLRKIFVDYPRIKDGFFPEG